MYAETDEYPSLCFQDIRKKPASQTDTQTDGQCENSSGGGGGRGGGGGGGHPDTSYQVSSQLAFQFRRKSPK